MAEKWKKVSSVPGEVLVDLCVTGSSCLNRKTSFELQPNIETHHAPLVNGTLSVSNMTGTPSLVLRFL